MDETKQPTQTVNPVCQHCGHGVAFGMTEHGYRGFVHVATSSTECPSEGSTVDKDRELLEQLECSVEGRRAIATAEAELYDDGVWTHPYDEDEG